MTEAAATVASGLFEIVAGEPRLLGSRCTGCDALYFPQTNACRNPRCHDKQVEAQSLPTSGKLHSYTVQHYRPPPPFRMDDWQPYAIGLIQFDGGLQVMGMLTGIDLDALMIGMPVTLVAEPLYSDAERGPVLTYKFAPAAFA